MAAGEKIRTVSMAEISSGFSFTAIFVAEIWGEKKERKRKERKRGEKME